MQAGRNSRGRKGCSSTKVGFVPPYGGRQAQGRASLDIQRQSVVGAWLPLIILSLFRVISTCHDVSTQDWSTHWSSRACGALVMMCEACIQAISSSQAWTGIGCGKCTCTGVGGRSQLLLTHQTPTCPLALGTTEASDYKDLFCEWPDFRNLRLNVVF